MTKYYPHGVNLSDGQQTRLAKGYQNNSAITIRLTANELTGPDEMMLTNTQINKLRKAMSMGKGPDIKISKTQIRKAVQHGRSLWSALFSLAPTIAKTVGLSALTGLASEGASQVVKITGKGQTGGFLVPQNKIDQLIKYKHLLSAGQNQQIVSTLQSGSGVVIKPTKTQSGGFLGTLLASIGIPLLVNALTGKRLHVDRSRPTRSLPVCSKKGRKSSLFDGSAAFFRDVGTPHRKGAAVRQKQSIQFQYSAKFYKQAIIEL